ncbi:MAG: beta-lactamase family protein [Acidobacteriia bacterium]|nr:beta-lactamase family protein [Terriglobia bacterium]
MAVSRNGTVLYEHGYGMANVELGVPITTETILGAASISKQFTAMSILLLAQRGRLSIDDQVNKYVPDWQNRESHVTIRHLLTHTSGLREGFMLLGLAQQNFEENVNDAMVRVLARQRGVNFAPGSEWQYNNGAYNLLGSIVQRVSGQSLRDFAETNIFRPLGMKNSQFRDSRGLIIPHVASGYSIDGTGVHPNSLTGGVVGNDGVYTTPRDLLFWEQNFEDVRVGTPEIVAAMQKPAVLTSGKTTGYGFGLFLGKYRGLRTVEHSGGDSGISSNVVRYPDQKLAIALLCNSDAINPIVLTHQLTDLYLGDVLGAPSGSGSPAVAKVPLKESELAARAGSYHVTSDPGVADLQVSVRDGKLIGHSFYDDGQDFDLIPTDTTHVRAPGPATLEFIPAALGHPPEWRLTGELGSLRGVLQQQAPFQPTAADLRALVGDYRSAEILASYDIVLRDSDLAIQPPGGAEVRLRPLGRDLFACDGFGVLRFLRGTRGDVAGFTMNRSNLRGLRFDRFREVE